VLFRNGDSLLIDPSSTDPSMRCKSFTRRDVRAASIRDVRPKGGVLCRPPSDGKCRLDPKPWRERPRDRADCSRRRQRQGRSRHGLAVGVSVADVALSWVATAWRSSGSSASCTMRGDRPPRVKAGAVSAPSASSLRSDRAFRAAAGIDRACAQRVGQPLRGAGHIGRGNAAVRLAER